MVLAVLNNPPVAINTMKNKRVTALTAISTVLKGVAWWIRYREMIKKNDRTQRNQLVDRQYDHIDRPAGPAQPQPGQDDKNKEYSDEYEFIIHFNS